MMIKNVFLSGFALTMLVGCSVGPDYKRPKLDMPKFVNTKADKEADKLLTEKWWGIFQDVTLNKLEETAVKNNADIRHAIAAIEAACAAAGVAAADFFPSVGLSGSRKDTRLSGKTNIGNTNSFITYNAAANISYEMDFWGKYRRANEAARADLLASHAAKESVLLTITAEVAKTYFLLRGLDAKLAIARRTFKVREESYLVYKSRFESGYCTELDYLRVASEMESVRSTVINLESSAEMVENTLSMLIGATPKEMVSHKTDRTSSLEKLRVPSDIPSGLPSNLLERRPDVMQAEEQLISANAAIGQAIAANFPSFSLTGILGLESKSLGSLFNAGGETHSYGAGIVLPIFAGGKISSMTAIAKANYKKMLALYEKTVQTAFKETLDALIVNRKNREVVISRTRQVNALKRSYSIAKTQKEAGLIGLIDLLDVERGLLAAEMDLTEALQNQLNAVVDLCKALGGGWYKFNCGRKKHVKDIATNSH